MIRPAWRSTTTANFSAVTNWTVNKPAGVVDGDLLLVAFACGSGTTFSTVPSGWALLSRTVFSTQELIIYWKIAASEGASWTWVFSTTQTGGMQCHAFSNVDTADPYINGGTTTSGTSTLTAPSVTPATVQDTLAAIYFSRTSAAGSMTQPTGMTERSDVAYGTTRLLAVDTEDLTSGAATGTRATTVTNFTTSGIAQSIIVRSKPTHQGAPLMMSM